MVPVGSAIDTDGLSNLEITVKGRKEQRFLDLGTFNQGWVDATPLATI